MKKLFILALSTLVFLAFSSISVNAQRSNYNHKNDKKAVVQKTNRKPNWQYTNAPRRNSVVTTVPSGYRTVTHGGITYRYHQGSWYKPDNKSFKIVAAPIGVIISVLPAGYRMVHVNAHDYYYHNGTYYAKKSASGYVVVSPPLGAVVESLHNGYETVVVNGETYYTADGAQYKPTVQENGEIWYEVIKEN